MANLVHSGTSGLNQYPVNYQLMRNLLTTAKSVAPYLAGSMPGELFKNGGTKAVKWEPIENLAEATTALSELTTDALPTRASAIPQISVVTVNMAKYGQPIRLTEELELMSVNARAIRFTRTLGENAGRSLSGVARDVMDAKTTDRFSNGSATSAVNTVLDATDVQYCVNQLNRADAMKFTAMGTGSRNIGTSPIRDAYLGICHSDVEEDVRAMTGFTPVEQYAGYTETFPGEFGTVGGVRWVSTSTAPINADAGAGTIPAGIRGTTAVDVYSTFILGQESFGTVGLGERHTKEIYKTGDKLAAVEVISKPLGSAGTADALNEVATVAWKAWFAATILNGNWLMKLESGASSLA